MKKILTKILNIYLKIVLPVTYTVAGAVVSVTLAGLMYPDIHLISSIVPGAIVGFGIGCLFNVLDK